MVTFMPMLAKSINPKQIDLYIQDDEWWGQQKLDGIRVLLTVEDGKVTGTSRSGRNMDLPDEAKEPFQSLKGLWRLDGEFVGGGEGVLWLFDLPVGGDVIDITSPYQDRYYGLTGIFDNLIGKNDDIKLVDVAKTPEEKRKLHDWCKANDAEGLMFKDRNGIYGPGNRSIHTLKAKFTETVDVVVLEVGREGKASCSVGAFHNGTLTDIGSVKMTDSQGLDRVKAGDVIEVRYLYATPDLRLYQPVFLKFRPDRDPMSCKTDQLKYTNKTVRKV
jgi:bifunctional non-homologous end joining protein LigD